MTMDNDQARLVIIYKAPSMIAANMVKGLLEHNKIPVVVRSLQIPMYDDIALMHSNVWGELLVPKNYQKQASELVKSYLASIEEDL
jgi:hypothetical protein